MQKKRTRSRADAGLRSRAEDQLRKRKGRLPTGAIGLKAVADTQRTLHELHVHQIELELQNEELRNARIEAETLLEKYTDLYDFAPVGFFSLDARGRILEANLTGATLLGVDRSQLIGQRLQRFAEPVSQPLLTTFLEQLFLKSERQLCEVTLQKVNGPAFSANVHGVPLGAASPAPKECRVAVSDITAIKQAEELRSRLEALAGANEEQRREIVRRKAIEEALERNAHQQRVMLEQSRNLHAQLRHLTHEILQAQEEERKRISRDLHDEITQTLVGINIHLEALSREVTTNPVRLKDKIARTQRVVEKAVDSVHRFARELRPAMLDDLGLIPALQTFLKAFTQKTGIGVSLNASNEIEQVKGPKRTALYRVAQEALANVSRHSRATQAEVILQRVPGGVLMQIKDNGKSFDFESVRHDNHGKRLGLIGMQERIEMVGGKFSVVSAPGQGTTIQAQVPLRNKK